MLTISATSEYSLLCSLPPPTALAKQQKLWLMEKYANTIDSVQEAVVGMNNITFYHSLFADSEKLQMDIQRLWLAIQDKDEQYQARLIEIPVHYGGEFGEDLYQVAQFHHTTPEEIVRRHTAPLYTVFMMGFQPGFPYLGGLPENLHTPRREVPRAKVPAGSVGIGGSQTGIYPFTSPGGWQLIGKTQVALFDATQIQPVLLQAGDQIRFVMESISL
ncbi:5-oxoprolinase subunit PxpB [Actinobacillus vicugnae]|uniref:5-oxoprolinase subunit PxpB n=1 Tax=Actinobacillus vicugnae TaxID=2573093 RepID=UPI0012429BC8|nr:5-oxoprolinase subunit PxpB [Actinobacillus vicugnae]